MSKPKFKKKSRIESIDELLKCEYVYIFGERPKHIAFVISLQLRTVVLAIKRGIYKAVVNDG